MADPNTIYSNSDNPLVLNFTLNAVPQTLVFATKIIVSIPAVSLSFDSVSNPTMFDLTQANLGIIAVNLSRQTLANGVYPLRVIVVDANHPDGVVWCHEDDQYPTTMKFVNLT